ncbi:hypothetical protein CDAR_391171 [Caerostris darwini]|uniref:Uncharacterized protein n=1 Tax=Caerostris darwini TaxID=1538125 RepID=A0AAV4SYF1_9ARAC|nr:hypothetical protein CDAR_391171 [Caerostris darwini]
MVRLDDSAGAVQTSFLGHQYRLSGSSFTEYRTMSITAPPGGHPESQDRFRVEKKIFPGGKGSGRMNSEKTEKIVLGNSTIPDTMQCNICCRHLTACNAIYPPDISTSLPHSLSLAP